MVPEIKRRFQNRKLKLITIITAVLILALITAWFGWSTVKTVSMKNRLEAQWQSLDITRRSINDLEKPESWAANIFIGNSVLKTVTQQLEGYRLEYIPTDNWLSGTTITVKTVSVEPKLGYALANLLLVAQKGGTELQMRLIGSITYHGVDHVKKDDPNKLFAIFKIEPLEIAPAARIGPFQFQLGNLWNKLSPDIAMAFSTPGILEFHVPVIDGVKANFGLDIKGAKNVVNKDTGATITYDINLPFTPLEQKLTFNSIVFRPEGIWLMARLSDGGDNVLLTAKPPAQSELATAVKELTEEIRHKTAKLIGDSKTLSVSLLSPLLTSVANKLGELSDASRTLTIQTTAREGHLAESKWRDNLLGDGGAYAELVDGRSGTVRMQFGKPTITWDANGLRMVMPANAAIKANIHFHFDPLIGGGMGTSAGIEGKGAGVINVTAQGKVIEGTEGLKVAVLNANLSCDAIQASATTDGVLKIDMGWISVPKVGAKAVIPLGYRQIGIIQLLSNHPFFVAKLPYDARLENDPVKRNELINKNPWAIIPPTGAISVRLVPESIITDATGVHTSASLQLASLNIGFTKDELDKAKKTVEEEAKIIDNKVAELLKQQPPVKECKSDPEIAILLGPIELGPKNDIVKFAKNAWNDMTKGPGPNNDLRKAVEAAGDALDKALPDITVGQGPGIGVTIGSWHF